MMYIDFSTIQRTCYACPTIYEWDDSNGYHFYFRLRHGHWRICYEDACGNEKLIVSGDADNDSDGCCSFDDVSRYTFNHGLIITEEPTIKIKE